MVLMLGGEVEHPQYRLLHLGHCRIRTHRQILDGTNGCRPANRIGDEQQ